MERVLWVRSAQDTSGPAPSEGRQDHHQARVCRLIVPCGIPSGIGRRLSTLIRRGGPISSRHGSDRLLDEGFFEEGFFDRAFGRLPSAAFTSATRSRR